MPTQIQFKTVKMVEIEPKVPYTRSSVASQGIDGWSHVTYARVLPSA